MPSHFLNYLNENGNSRSPLLQNSQSNVGIKSNINNVIGRPLNDSLPTNFDSILK